MALPLTRNRTYSVGSPVVAADLNDIQDQIIAMYAGRRAAKRRPHPALIGAQLVGTTGVKTNGGFTNALSSDIYSVPLIVNQGERITLIECVVNPAASGLVTADFLRVDDVAEANINRGSASSSGAALQTLSIIPTTGSETVPATNFSYVVQFSFTVGGGHLVRSVYVTSDVL